ncbi:MAG: hypothetical protein HN729_08860 [Candidatus Marinimicrobia bacterium]|nr:hypothetical protein [Candidatus Neomarinimicrobiota bacterium]MBT3683625.1 hypothetical protein [Candidatus Neomarinimicrobiota bacterium]MBT3760404.1 hypothetical protein [Candidatus Neomarinimicrobiota bacterium]MBT3896518.1 hypothetical protein [Candidatus Neomarinimicrobiota bacterium]MBT4173568.1 hypothetical protein [Candidatus Neomarinimicrobiota bacterium]
MTNPYTEWAWPWWTVMVSINIINLIVCIIVYRKSLLPEDGIDSVYRKRMRIMGVLFVLIGLYRAIFVSMYFSQLAWFDSLANSVLLIRIFAWVAELSFSGQIALAMLKVNVDLPDVENNGSSWRNFRSFMMTKTPYILWTSILLAQFFATGGLIFKSKTLFAIEETLWLVGFLSVLPLAIVQLRRVADRKNVKTLGHLRLLRNFTRLNLAWCVIYCCYSLLYHLPFECWPSAIHQLETGIPLIKTGLSAISDAFLIVYESKTFSDWGIGFLFWHSAYFSICVWISIFLMQAPRIIHGNISKKK